MIDPVEYFFTISIESTFKALMPDTLQIVSIIVCLLSVVLCIAYRRRMDDWKRVVFYIFLVEYLFLLFYITVVKREPSPDYQVELVPLWSYFVRGERLPNIILEVILNVFLFVPLGVLLGARRFTLKRTMLYSCCLSVVIETIQLMAKRGLCETDDVIHNLVGTLLGFGIVNMMAIFYTKIIETRTKNSNYVI